MIRLRKSRTFFQGVRDMQWDSMERWESREHYLSYKRLFTPEPDALAFVENERDSFFWKWVFRNYAGGLKVDVKFRYSEKLSGGKKELLKLKEKDVLCEEILICLDSDYDYLLQNNIAHTMAGSPYIFQTYAYSVENYNCLAESLDLVCIQATSIDHHLLDFVKFMKDYSNIVYSLLLYSVYFERIRSKKFRGQREKDKTFTRNQLYAYINLDDGITLSNNGEEILQRLQKKVVEKEEELKKLCPDEELKEIAGKLGNLHINKDNAYLFIKGKYILNGVICRLLKVVVSDLIKRKIQEYEQHARDERALENKLYEYICTVGQKPLKKREDFLKAASGTTYLEYLKNELASVSPNLPLFLRNNVNIQHDGCELMGMIKQDVEEYVKRFRSKGLTT